MRVSQNLSLCKLTNRINMNLLIFGDATVDSGWHGKVTSPPFSRLYYITTGSFTIVGKDGKSYVLQPDRWYLIPSGYSFSYNCQEEMRHFYFHLKVCDLDGADLLENCLYPMSIDCNDFDSTFFASCISSNNFLDGIKLRNALWSIIFSFIKKGNVDIDSEDYSKYICNALIYIRRNLSMQLSVSKIAENCFISKSTLTKHFKKELSLSVNEYVSNMVLAEAERLLSVSNISVAEISQRLGFSDQFYFSRKFKEQFGVSPREYRKNNLL